MTVMEALFRGFKFELPSTRLRELHVTDELVRAPDEALERLLDDTRHEQEDLRRADAIRYAEQLGSEDGFSVTWDEEALDQIVKRSMTAGKTVRGYCEDRFRDLLYGLRLIAQHEGRNEFTLNAHIVEAPDKEISEWIARSFK